MPRILRHRNLPGHHRFLPLFLAAAAALTAVTIVFAPSLRPHPVPHRLADLPIPDHPAAVTLPEPLTIAKPAANVLGAEPVNPDDIVTYVNEERMKRDIPPLRVNSLLTKAAQLRANVIIRYQNFSHYDPYEQTVLTTVLPKVGYTYSYASENIGMGGVSGKDFVAGFMSSAAHRDNLLDPKLEETGVGTATGPYRQFFVNVAVQLFGEPADRSTYLGYTSDDVARYGEMLTDIARQLVTVRHARSADGTSDYYRRWETILIKQHEIMARLTDTMRHGKPFTEELIALIREYNANWLEVPRS
jgi:uncharacterized protein YkwD